MTRLYWFKWMPAEFTAQTNGWAPETVGALVRLLSASWVQGSLPDDETSLRMITGLNPKQWRKAWPVIESRFPIHADGRRCNPEMEQERLDARACYEASVKKSTKGNKKRWAKPSLEESSDESLSDPESQSQSQSDYSSRSTAP